MFGHGAEPAFGETFSGDVEGAVEAGAGIFPSDDGGEFDELAVGEMFAESGVEFVGDVGGRSGEFGCKSQDESLLLVEVGAAFELRNVVKLVFGDSGFSANGRMDVDSKGTADHQGGFELREFLEMHRDGTFSGGVQIHAQRGAQEFGIEGADTGAQRDAAKVALGQKKDETRDRAGLIVLDALGARHE